jgi:cysteine desulfurase
MIYLDHNATTPVDPSVREAICECLGSIYGNPSSTHLMGRQAREAVEGARAQVAKLLSCGLEEVYFTSGGTESNNLAIMGTARKHSRGHIITSRIEHPSVLNPVKHLEAEGFGVTRTGVDGDGRVLVEEVEKAVREDTILITVMHSNNETGVLQPIEELSKVARAKGIPLHTDAAQSVGKVPVNVQDVDMLTIATHKFYGPKGTGAIYIRNSARPLPILFGAGHEGGMRPGTENVPGIVGLGRACELAMANLEAWASHLAGLKRLLLEELEKTISGIRVNGHETLSLPGTLNVSIPGVDAVELTWALREKVAVSSGSACHAGEKSPSPVLKAMGLSDEEAMSSVRLSLGKDNTADEIKDAARMISEACRLLARAR